VTSDTRVPEEEARIEHPGFLIESAGSGGLPTVVSGMLSKQDSGGSGPAEPMPPSPDYLE